MDKKAIYTIGHGNRKIEDFLKSLKDFGIQYLIDVRSQPYSKFNPQFNQSDLKYFLNRHGIIYIFMGDTIGGRPTDRTCYDDEGKVDYDKVKTKDFFKQGIDRLKIAYQKNLPIVVMCSESKPSECHRSKLIGRVLSDENIFLKHIDEKGKLKTQADVINELNKGLSDQTLFPEEISMNSTSRKSYL
ncbi:MAG: hypothetical protein JWQ09_474 [Segetibacter sp.]|nr:hypothetical protein [Segetibacter sp.]